MTITIPMPLPSAANLREHHMVRARRVKAQRTWVAAYLRGPPPALPVVVTLTRIAPRALDGDNLQGAFKGVRDQVAAWLGHKDNHPGITWDYAQARGESGETAISIRVEARS